MTDVPYPSATSHGDNSPVIQNNGTVHGGINTLVPNPHDLPENRLNVAVNHLQSGTPRFAESLLADVLKTKLGDNPSVLYHYLVASLSDRSLGELEDQHRQALDSARRLLDDGTTGTEMPSRRHLRNLVLLVDLAERLSDYDGQPTKNDSERMRQACRSLPPEHRRLLDHLLSGPTKNAAFREHADEIRMRRSREIDSREQRVWKFFEPDPAEPRERSRPRPAVTKAFLALCAVGVLLFMAGLVGIAGQLDSRAESRALVTTIVLAGTGLLLHAGVGWRRIRDRMLLEERTARFQGRRMGTSTAPEADNLRSAFKMVDVAFNRVSPRAPSWPGMTAGLRQSLAYDIVEEYDPTDVTAGRLRWLVRWHAEQVLNQWRAKQLLDHQQTFRDRKALRWADWAGAVLLGIALLIVVYALRTDFAAESLLPLAAAGGGLILLWRRPLDLAGRRSAHRVMTKWSADRYASERAEWLRWSHVLSDRPTDMEMAAWLADDIDIFKADVMSERGIQPSDVICALELATPDEWALRARLAFGPIRYSRYVLTLFLLTRSGVRQFQTHLTFSTAELLGEQRRSFAYGALREVLVEQESIRLARSDAVAPQFAVVGAGAGESRSTPGSLHRVGVPASTSTLRIHRRKFLIRLDSGGNLEIALGNFDDLKDLSEPSGLVARLALEATGVESALHVLETVVVDGTDWITKEQARRHGSVQPAEPSSIAAEPEHQQETLEPPPYVVTTTRIISGGNPTVPAAEPGTADVGITAERRFAALFTPESTAAERIQALRHLGTAVRARIPADDTGRRSRDALAERSAALLSQLAVRLPIRTADTLRRQFGAEPDTQSERVIAEAGQFAGMLWAAAAVVPGPPPVVRAVKRIIQSAIEIRMIAELYVIHDYGTDRDENWLYAVLLAWAAERPVARGNGSAAATAAAIVRKIRSSYESIDRGRVAAIISRGAGGSDAVLRLGARVHRRIRLSPLSWVRPNTDSIANAAYSVLQPVARAGTTSRALRSVLSAVWPRPGSETAGTPGTQMVFAGPHDALKYALTLHEQAAAAAGGTPTEAAAARLGAALVDQQRHLTELKRSLSGYEKPETGAETPAAVEPGDPDPHQADRLAWQAEDAIDAVEALGARPRRLPSWSSRQRASLAYLLTALVISALPTVVLFNSAGYFRIGLLVAQCLALPWLSVVAGAAVLGPLYRPWLGGPVRRHLALGTGIVLAAHVGIGVLLVALTH